MDTPSNIKTLFNFSKDQRKGILVLFFIIIALQLVYCFMDFNPTRHPSKEEQHWLSLQDKLVYSKEFNSKSEYKEYSYNPNFISDFKSNHNIQLDFVYTGKMMFGIFDLIKKNYFEIFM